MKARILHSYNVAECKDYFDLNTTIQRASLVSSPWFPVTRRGRSFSNKYTIKQPPGNGRNNGLDLSVTGLRHGLRLLVVVL